MKRGEYTSTFTGQKFGGAPKNNPIKALSPRDARINFQMAIEKTFDIKVNIEYN